jgi:hypothetical protein
MAQVMARSACLLALAAVVIGCGSGSAKGTPAAPVATAAATAAAAKPTDRFDVARAWRLTRHQVALGQRPAGSPQLRRLARTLRAALPHGRFEPIPGEKGLRNVVGVLPGKRPGLVIGAHYDTLVKPKGFVGANNGAAGTAIVVEAARALGRLPRPAGAREIRFVLFDGEEPEAGLPEDSADFYNTGLRGSRAYVEANPTRTSAMVLLDYVANKGLQLPREGSSDPGLWANLRSAARAAGVLSYFPDADGVTIIDDHTPFLRSGVPAIDLIDWNYEGHDLTDGIDKLSKKSMDAVGETVVELARRMRAG